MKLTRSKLKQLIKEDAAERGFSDRGSMDRSDTGFKNAFECPAFTAGLKFFAAKTILPAGPGLPSGNALKALNSKGLVTWYGAFKMPRTRKERDMYNDVIEAIEAQYKEAANKWLESVKQDPNCHGFS